jgi:alkylation response protein AidB-like acyl-CoA dehydrogenase
MGMGIGSTPEHVDLRDMVRKLVAKELPLADTRDADPASARTAGLSLLAELGLLGIAVPEHFGGSGAGLRELAIVTQELARELAPVPYFTTACLATETLLASGDDAACAELLPGLCVGERTATLAAGTGVAAGAGDTWTVTADLRAVPDGADADIVLVVAQTTSGAALFAVADGIQRSRLTTLDPSRSLAQVHLDNAAARLIGALGAGADIVARARVRATAVLAAEQAAVAEHCVETTRQYLLDRRQFGRQIGAFQALKHRLADAAVRAEWPRAVPGMQSA